MVRSELSLMKRFGGEFMSDMDDQGSVLAMDIDDDVEPLELFGESIQLPDSTKLVDRDFFNSFEDDFDDADIPTSIDPPVSLPS